MLVLIARDDYKIDFIIFQTSHVVQHIKWHPRTPMVSPCPNQRRLGKNYSNLRMRNRENNRTTVPYIFSRGAQDDGTELSLDGTKFETKD